MEILPQPRETLVPLRLDGLAQFGPRRGPLRARHREVEVDVRVLQPRRHAAVPARFARHISGLRRLALERARDPQGQRTLADALRAVDEKRLRQSPARDRARQPLQEFLLSPGTLGVHGRPLSHRTGSTARGPTVPGS